MPNEAKRDPRVDPKPGDVLAKGRDERIVNAVTKRYVEGHTLVVYQGANWLYPNHGQFRKWAKLATVLHAAD